MSFFVASHYKIGSFSSENSFLMKINSLEDKIINKQTQPCNFGDEIQKRFAAYVKEAMRNTRSTYYKKKMIKEEREVSLEVFDSSVMSDLQDILDEPSPPLIVSPALLSPQSFSQ